MPEFKVLKGIVVDGKPKEPGSKISVSADAARTLVAKGYVEKPKGNSKS